MQYSLEHRGATLYVYWGGAYAQCGAIDGERHYRGASVHGARLVEDEVADAVEDVAAAICFVSLQRMWMVTDDAVGTGIDAVVCKLALQRLGARMVFPPPMRCDDDNPPRMCLP